MSLVLGVSKKKEPAGLHGLAGLTGAWRCFRRNQTGNTRSSNGGFGGNGRPAAREISKHLLAPRKSGGARLLLATRQTVPDERQQLVCGFLREMDIAILQQPVVLAQFYTAQHQVNVVEEVADGPQLQP